MYTAAQHREVRERVWDQCAERFERVHVRT